MIIILSSVNFSRLEIKAYYAKNTLQHKSHLSYAFIDVKSLFIQH